MQRLREKMHALTIERVRRRKIFLEERLAEVRQDRTEAQDALTAFQQEFGVINLAAQSESAIQSVTALKTELYRKEVELHSQIELLGENTAAVVRLRSAVDQLRTLIREIEHGFVEFQDSSIPLQELPALGVRYLDLATELSVHDTIYAFLRSQYESTRIEENAKESAFQIVEEVEVPLRKSRPSRADLHHRHPGRLHGVDPGRVRRGALQARRVRSGAAPAARRNPPGDWPHAEENRSAHMMKRALAILPILCIVVLHATAQDNADEQRRAAAKRSSRSASASRRRRRFPTPSCWPRC